MRNVIALVLVGCAGAAVDPKPPAPVTPIAAVTNAPPCIAQATPLLASAIYKQLERYAMSLYANGDEGVPPPTRFGTCTVKRNVITAADGSLVGELGCGMRVVKRGIVDQLGIEVGAPGQTVLDRLPKPLLGISCVSNGPGQSRCSLAREEGSDTDSNAYVIAGTFEGGVLEGDEAVALFAKSAVVELHVSFWCH